MRLFVTGAGGQLGRAVLDAAADRGAEALGVSHAELAVENRGVVLDALRRHRPDHVFHCAAWTDVDGCEADPERAALCNGDGTAHVAEGCRDIGAGLVVVSTDFVFDGSSREPYRVDAPPSPISSYGQSKLRGEQAALESGAAPAYVVRTAWVFGPGGRNFPRAILARARSGQPLRVVDDQVGSPTMTRDLAEALLDLAVSGAESGIYHACNEGFCSWHGFAQQILERAGMGDVEVGRMSSVELNRPAARPAYSVLDCARLTSVRGRALPNYLDALGRYLAEELK